jgi:hypothetical protein
MVKQQKKDLEKQLEEEEEDAFLKQDTSKWDIFKDADKFERRDEILKKRKQREVEEELKSIRSHREMKEENFEVNDLKQQITRLNEKVTYRDNMIDKKAKREQELLD